MQCAYFCLDYRDLCTEAYIFDPLRKCFEPSARIKVQTWCQRREIVRGPFLMLTPLVTPEGGLNQTVIACAPNVCQDSETQALRAALFLSTRRLSAKRWWMWCTLICDRQVGARTQMTSRIWRDAALIWLRECGYRSSFMPLWRIDIRRSTVWGGTAVKVS